MAGRSSEEVLSRKLSYTLRHKAVQLGLPIKEDGFVPIDAILKLDIFKNFVLDDILKAVENNEKQRFCIQKNNIGQLEIRANQGHTFEVPKLELRRITDHSEFPVVVHGTTRTAWETIKVEGLSRMSRTHIHFAVGVPGDNQVISGMRSSCQVWIFIDLVKAMNDGIEFVVSANNVILCAGVNGDGRLPAKYFSHVLNAKTCSPLQF